MVAWKAEGQHSRPHQPRPFEWASQASLPPVHDDGPKAPTGPFACHGPCRQRQYVWLPLIATGFTAAEAGARRGRRSWPRRLIRQNGGPRCPRRRAVRPAYPRTQDAAGAPVVVKPLDLSGNLSGGQGGGALLRLAQGRVPQAGSALREALEHLRRPGLPGLLPHQLEAFEMSSVAAGAERRAERPGW